METIGLRKSRIQSQLKRLLFAMLLIICLNLGFLWYAFDQLFLFHGEAVRSSHLTGLVGDLELLIYQENQFKSDASIDDASRATRLEDLRAGINANFKEILNELGQDKKRLKKVKEIQAQWATSRSSKNTLQVLLLINGLIKEINKSPALSYEEQGAPKLLQASIALILLFKLVFIFSLFVLGQYFKIHLFKPLAKLSEDMQNFKAGNYELPMKTFSDDEIGDLESKFVDMAERIESTVDDLKHLDKVKTDFLSLASHELRTPMTSVKGSLSLILSGNLNEIDPDIKELLLISEKETDRLIRLINDILDLTKIEAHKAALDKKWYSLSEIIKTSVEGLQGLYGVTGVKVDVVQVATPCEVEVDKDRLHQVLTNLISNAVKFSPKGSTVEVNYELSPDGSEVTVYVKDHGPGIREEDQMQMFEKFRSRDSGMSKIIKGTGLGLPICKALIEEHGGRIGVRSVLGEGSTFFFTLSQVRVLETPHDSVAA